MERIRSGTNHIPHPHYNLSARFSWRSVVPRFYFHLSTIDGSLGDAVGYELSDLSAAHGRAKQFVRRISKFSGLADHEPDRRHWRVSVADGRHLEVLTVIFPTGPAFPEGSAGTPVNGVHLLQQSLRANWNRNDRAIPRAGLRTAADLADDRRADGDDRFPGRSRGAGVPHIFAETIFRGRCNSAVLPPRI